LSVVVVVDVVVVALLAREDAEEAVATHEQRTRGAAP
jgi:hypothetical protein